MSLTAKLNPDRFWSTADRSGGPDACWTWQGYKNRKGYGRYSPSQRGSARAHRVAYALVNPQDNIDGLCVCHSCDNPSCVNPAHLWLGSVRDNNSDRRAKGHYATGENHFAAKLSEETVKLIRGSALGDIELARHFGVHRATIRAARCGRTWGENQ